VVTALFGMMQGTPESTCQESDASHSVRGPSYYWLNFHRPSIIYEVKKLVQDLRFSWQQRFTL